MHGRLRAMVVPFCVTLTPALHYVERNLTTRVLPPRTEPTVGLLAAGVGVSLLVAVVVAGVVAQFRRRNVTDPRTLPRARRLLQPDDTTLTVCGVFALAAGVLMGQNITGVTLPWVDIVATAVLAPAAIPMVLLAPFVIRSNSAVLLGYVLSGLWAALLATYVSDWVEERRTGRSVDGD